MPVSVRSPHKARMLAWHARPPAHRTYLGTYTPQNDPVHFCQSPFPPTTHKAISNAFAHAPTRFCQSPFSPTTHKAISNAFAHAPTRFCQSPFSPTIHKAISNAFAHAPTPRRTILCASASTQRALPRPKSSQLTSSAVFMSGVLWWRS
jgi:hypothetical protein